MIQFGPTIGFCDKLFKLLCGPVSGVNKCFEKKLIRLKLPFLIRNSQPFIAGLIYLMMLFSQRN